jgi:hypothetical protein
MKESISANDIKPGSKFKLLTGTIFVIEKVENGEVTSHIEGGGKGNYRNLIDDAVSFFNDEKAKKV